MGYYHIKIDSIKQLHLLATILHGWVFRGQANFVWDLETSIERAANQFKCKYYHLWHIENKMINEMKSHAHFYLRHLPLKDDLLDWLSLLQHYGCPTRLLDFTYSLYVAAYFALESSIKDSAIWAINPARLNTNEKILKSLKVNPNDFSMVERLSWLSKTIENRNVNCQAVINIQPKFLNDRIVIQQGLFLIPLDIGSSFEQNLCTSFYFPFKSFRGRSMGLLNMRKIKNIAVECGVIKIIISKDCHSAILLALKSMNITSAQLFPGLDGFARSLKTHL